MNSTPHTTMSREETCMAVTSTGERAMPRMACTTSRHAAVCAASRGISTAAYTAPAPPSANAAPASTSTYDHPAIKDALYAKRYALAILMLVVLWLSRTWMCWRGRDGLGNSRNASLFSRKRPPRRSSIVDSRSRVFRRTVARRPFAIWDSSPFRFTISFNSRFLGFIPLGHAPRRFEAFPKSRWEARPGGALFTSPTSRRIPRGEHPLGHATIRLSRALARVSARRGCALGAKCGTPSRRK